MYKKHIDLPDGEYVVCAISNPPSKTREIIIDGGLVKIKGNNKFTFSQQVFFSVNRLIQ